MQHGSERFYYYLQKLLLNCAFLVLYKNHIELSELKLEIINSKSSSKELVYFANKDDYVVINKLLDASIEQSNRFVTKKNIDRDKFYEDHNTNTMKDASISELVNWIEEIKGE